jgi:hypothetical protein
MDNRERWELVQRVYRLYQLCARLTQELAWWYAYLVPEGPEQNLETVLNELDPTGTDEL